MPDEWNRIFVTGGAGFIGSNLADRLLADGHEVVVYDDFSTGHRANLAHHAARANIEVVEGDIRDPATVAAALDGVQVVFHLACRGVRHSIGKPWESHAVNAGGALTLLIAARASGVERFIHVSSSEVYGTARRVPMDEEHPCYPETVYGAAKLAGEAYARALSVSGVLVTHRRFDGQIHGFLNMGRIVADAARLVTLAGDALKGAFKAP